MVGSNTLRRVSEQILRVIPSSTKLVILYHHSTHDILRWALYCSSPISFFNRHIPRYEMGLVTLHMNAVSWTRPTMRRVVWTCGLVANPFFHQLRLPFVRYFSTLEIKLC
jgi:hypothetical protein